MADLKQIKVGNTTYNIEPYTKYLPLAGGTLTGTLGFKSNYLVKPVAEFRTQSDRFTGAITIALPAGISNTMVSMWIDVYNYSTNTSFSVHVGGYTYENNTWQHNPFAMVYGANHTVRLGHNGTNFVIYIGETNSTWSYPQISVRDVILGFRPDYDNWKKDWGISFVTNFSNVSATINNYAWTTKNFTPPTSLPANGGNADYANSAGDADTVDGDHSSAFAHVGAHNDLTASGNEFTFASSGFSGQIYLNWRTAGGTNGNITEYILGNGAGGQLGTIIHSGNIGSQSVNYANSTGIINPHQNVSSTGVSTWDPTSSGKIIWGQKFANDTISSDTGDLTLFLRPAVYVSDGTELCMNIDGDYYSMGNKMARMADISNMVTTDTDQSISGYKTISSIGIDTINGATLGNAIMRQNTSTGDVILGSTVRPLRLWGNGDRPTYSKDDGASYKNLALSSDLDSIYSTISSMGSAINSKADSNHTHDYLPLSGGVVTGETSFNDVLRLRSSSYGIQFNTANYTVSNMESGSVSMTVSVSAGSTNSKTVTFHDGAKGVGSWHIVVTPEKTYSNYLAVGISNISNTGFTILTRTMGTIPSSGGSMNFHYVAVKYW